MLQRGQRRTAASVETERGDWSKKTGHPHAPSFCSEGLYRPHLRVFFYLRFLPLFLRSFFILQTFFKVYASPSPCLLPSQDSPASTDSSVCLLSRLSFSFCFFFLLFFASLPSLLPTLRLVSRSWLLRLSFKMGFFLPALFVGGLGMTQHLASRELDDLIRQAEQPLFGFWWGVGFGVVVGVWVGCNFASFFRRLKTLSLALCDLASSRGGEDGGRGLRDEAPGRDSRDRCATATRDGSCAP
ncbi:putative transmembrane protein [Toxoplasma gondii VAND]|uniref:Putative transmembrane protein n=1 Tax=Toxoplasma gondii VAND TaxID=933077 RepID=A0A086PU26_TOXGO|nr:putative transmembrane protein [Toxoplasma gondii VAND]